MPAAARQSHRGTRFRTPGRGGAADRTARCGHRIGRDGSRPARTDTATAVCAGKRIVAFWPGLYQKMTRFQLDFRGSYMSGFSTARQKMVDGQVRTSDVTDSRILDAMLEVPREAFVPDDKQALAYLDLDLDVSVADGPKRYLIKPAVTAKLLQAAEIKHTDKVLVVGAATGYAAALAAKLAGQVTATESDPSLAENAGTVLRQLGCAGVAVRNAPVTEGDPTGAPYDVIFLNGATEIMPQRLLGQLKG